MTYIVMAMCAMYTFVLLTRACCFVCAHACVCIRNPMYIPGLRLCRGGTGRLGNTRKHTRAHALTHAHARARAAMQVLALQIAKAYVPKKAGQTNKAMLIAPAVVVVALAVPL